MHPAGCKRTIQEPIDEIQNIKPTNRIELRVFEWNKNALKLYENEGFKIQPESTFKFKYNNDELWTNLYMLKTFNEN